jgi:hypothetical protein
MDIENELEEGRIPLDLLQRLAELNPVSEPKNDVERLSEEYRQIAKNYSEQEWQSNFYLELSRLLDEEDDDGLLDFVDSLKVKLTTAWEKYCKDFELVPTKSAETEVGHALMQDAYETWMEALFLVEEGYPDDEVLEAAENAVRLLAAVTQLDRDVQSQAKILNSNPTFQTGR